MSTNWFGLEYHPTDSYIDWCGSNQIEKATKLRAAYDKIVELGLADQLKVLLDAAYHQGSMDESDANNTDL